MFEEVCKSVNGGALDNMIACYAESLADLAIGMFDRVGLEPTQLYRLVGIGLSNFQSDEEPPLFSQSPSAGQSEPVAANEEAGGPDATDHLHR